MIYTIFIKKKFILCLKKIFYYKKIIFKQYLINWTFFKEQQDVKLPTFFTIFHIHDSTSIDQIYQLYNTLNYRKNIKFLMLVIKDQYTSNILQKVYTYLINYDVIKTLNAMKKFLYTWFSDQILWFKTMNSLLASYRKVDNKVRTLKDDLFNFLLHDHVNSNLIDYTKVLYDMIDKLIQRNVNITNHIIHIYVELHRILFIIPSRYFSSILEWNLYTKSFLKYNEKHTMISLKHLLYH